MDRQTFDVETFGLMQVSAWPTLMTKHPFFAGRAMLGHGHYAIVLDNGESVLKLTTCQATHHFLTQGLAQLKNEAVRRCFPRVVQDYGVVAQFKTDFTQEDIYCIEMERLAPIAEGSPEAGAMALYQRLYERINDIVEDITDLNMAPYLPCLVAADYVMVLRALKPSPRRDALLFAAEYVVSDNGFSCLDIQVPNAMLRADGQLVFTDLLHTMT